MKNKKGLIYNVYYFTIILFHTLQSTYFRYFFIYKLKDIECN